MIIHQAISGENSKNAWDLLNTSMSDEISAKNIAFKSDLQDQSRGIFWESSIRGFLYENYFLLMRTFPDDSPNVRPGRAFSHVLIISKKDIKLINDISQLFKFLPNSINKDCELDKIDFQPTILNQAKDDKIFEKRFNKVVHGYVNLDEYNNTIIWIGDKDYEKTISRFWQIISLEEKYKLNFGINFNVDAIQENKLNLINTPENIESKFINRGYCIVRIGDQKDLTKLSEQIIAGDKEATKRIGKFKKAIGLSNIDIAEIDKVAIVIPTFENFENVQDFKKINTLAHVIANYSPSPEKGVQFKMELIERLVSIVEDSDLLNIILLKSFKVDSFKKSELLLKKAIKSWFSKNLFAIKEAQKINFLPLFQKLKDNREEKWWLKAIKKELENFVGDIDTKRAGIIISWIQNDDYIFRFIKNSIDTSKESEEIFVEKIPNEIEESKVEEIIQFSIKREWFFLHSKLLLFKYSFKEALTEHLKVLPPTSGAGIEIILERKLPIDIIEFTVTNGDERLIFISGKMCSKSPELVSNIDIRNSNWRKILLNYLQNGNSFEDIDNAPVIIEQIYDALIDGIAISGDLLLKVSATRYSNILNYPKRSELWVKIPSQIRPVFLEKTSSKLLNNISNDSTVEVPTDPVLSNYILQNGISDFLYFNRANIKSVLPVLIAFEKIPQHVIKDYISNFKGELDLIDAIQIGRLVKERNFNNVANEIRIKANDSNEFKRALSECYTTLDFFDQCKVWLSNDMPDIDISINDWWESFTEVSIRLYNGGPTQNKIWTISGGEEYDLLAKATGKEIWIDALRKLREGSASGITEEQLLNEMIKEHKTNNELKILKQLRDKL